MTKSKKKTEVISLDEVLEKKEPIMISELEPAPMVTKAPRGWPLLFGTKGDTWYEKALAYEKEYGHKVIPVKYRQVSDTEVIERDEDEIKQLSEELEPFWAEGEK